MENEDFLGPSQAPKMTPIDHARAGEDWLERAEADDRDGADEASAHHARLAELHFQAASTLIVAGFTSASQVTQQAMLDQFEQFSKRMGELDD
jgi:hypothetical protein